jgi:hypothetical protein
MQTFDQIIRQTRTLPENIQQEILHFVESVLAKYQTPVTTAKSVSSTPFAIYQTLDLGIGGYAQFPSNRAKQGIRELLLRKHKQ